METCLKNWLDVLEKYYLNEFIKNGGSAFKLLLTDSEEQTAAALSEMRDLAEKRNYVYAEVSAVETRVDKIDQTFFAIAGSLDWQRLSAHDAGEFIKRHFEHLPDGADLSNIDGIADATGEPPDEVARKIRTSTRDEIVLDHGMCKELRAAMAWLRMSQFFPRESTSGDVEVIVSWLRGEKVSLDALRRLSIYSRIERHNARDILQSLSHWLAKSGKSGLFIAIELSAILTKPRRGETKDPSVMRYRQPDFLDALEVLREFIDGLDEMTHCLICAVAPTELETGQTRSLTTYNALRNRLINEVHDSKRRNLLAAKVHVADKHETDGRDAL